MKTPAFARLAALALLTCLAAATAWPQAAPAPAAAPGAAGTASAPQAAASNPLLVLPQWAQDKVLSARADPKVQEQAYKHGAKLASFCANCHGPAGQSVNPEVPNLAGQNTIYVLNQLNKFHEGKRRGAFFMEGLVKAMSNEERFAVAVYYTSQEAKSVPVADATLAAKGKDLYDKGCKRCHGAYGLGSERSSRIAGQQPDYLDKSIRRYRANDVRADEKMYKYTKSLTDGDIQALVAYIRSM